MFKIHSTDFDDRVCKLTDSLAEVLVAKNKDYGDAYAKSVDKYGQSVTLVRLSDKFSRLENLILSKDTALVSESIEDTLLDLAGYAILELERRQRITTKINMAPDHIKIIATEINIRPQPSPFELQESLRVTCKPAYADLDD